MIDLRWSYCLRILHGRQQGTPDRYLAIYEMAQWDSLSVAHKYWSHLTNQVRRLMLDVEELEHGDISVGTGGLNSRVRFHGGR
jgi:hypothetical protein